MKENKTEQEVLSEQRAVQEQNYIIEELHFVFNERDMERAGESGKGTPPIKIT